LPLGMRGLLPVHPRAALLSGLLGAPRLFWILAGAAGAAAGVAFRVVLLGNPLSYVPGTISPPFFPNATQGANPVQGAIIGFVLGLPQWFLLRRQAACRRWVLVTTLALAIGLMLVPLVGMVAATVAPVILFGLAVLLDLRGPAMLAVLTYGAIALLAVTGFIAGMAIGSWVGILQATMLPGNRRRLWEITCALGGGLAGALHGLRIGTSVFALGTSGATLPAGALSPVVGALLWALDPSMLGFACAVGSGLMLAVGLQDAASVDHAGVSQRIVRGCGAAAFLALGGAVVVRLAADLSLVQLGG